MLSGLVFIFLKSKSRSSTSSDAIARSWDRRAQKLSPNTDTTTYSAGEAPASERRAEQKQSRGDAGKADRRGASVRREREKWGVGQNNCEMSAAIMEEVRWNAGLQQLGSASRSHWRWRGTAQHTLTHSLNHSQVGSGWAVQGSAVRCATNGSTRTSSPPNPSAAAPPPPSPPSCLP